MDPVILLFRLITKITTSEGSIRPPYLHLDPVQGGNVSVQHLFLGICPKRSLQIRGRVGLSPSSFEGFQHTIFALEVLLSAILAVYASIALAYAIRWYKKLWHSANRHAHGKSPRKHYKPRYIGYHIV